MRTLHAVLLLMSITVALGLTSGGCGSDDSDSKAYANLQACVDDLKSPEGGAIDTKTAIAMCISDKTIGDAMLSFTTKEECITYVTANTTGFMPNAIDAGCQMYIDGK